MADLKNLELRLPPLDAALALEGLGMEAQRDEFGMTWCAAHGIGARRMIAGPAPLREIDMVSAAPARMLLDQVRVFLSEMCRECPHEQCPMKAF